VPEYPYPGCSLAAVQACSASPIGKKTPDALYVHLSAIDQLPASLRLLEGCARAYIGRVEGANLVKLSRLEPKIFYLTYPTFDDDPHPALAQSFSVHL
jgi:DNA phosphorothioation-associated putative methyltransferase